MRIIPESRIDIESVFQGQKDKYRVIQEAKIVIGQLVQGLIGASDVDVFLNGLNGGSCKFLTSPNKALKEKSPMAALRKNAELDMRQKQE